MKFFSYLCRRNKYSEAMKAILYKGMCLSFGLLLSLPLLAQESYPIAFDRDADRTRTDRVLNGIVLNGNSFPHPPFKIPVGDPGVAVKSRLAATRRIRRKIIRQTTNRDQQQTAYNRRQTDL